MKYRFILPLTALAGLTVNLVLAACGGATQTAGSQPGAVSGGAMPRADRPSAADMQVGEGTDICDQFPAPVPEPYDPGDANPLNPVPGEHVRGAGDDAPITIISYASFDCDECDQLAAGLKTLTENYPDEVRVVFRHLPQTDNARTAALAAEAAADQGGEDAFWAMHDLLYERQGEWRSLAPASLTNVLSDYAGELGLDAEQLIADVESGAQAAVVDASASSAPAVGVSVAPTIYINDVSIDNPDPDPAALELLLQIMRLRQLYHEPPPMVIDPEHNYVAWIETENGYTAVNLFADLAPQTVNSFAYLACTGYYDNLTWHRVIPGFVAQTGDPTGTGVGGPGYTVVDEYFGSGLTFDRAGLLSMAHTDQPNSARGQFFITYGPAEHLNGAFTIFGEVVAGMDFLLQLTARDQSNATTELPPGDPLITIIVRETD